MSSWYWWWEYEFSDGDVYRTSIERQEIACPSCGTKLHGQYTHTWKNRNFPKLDALGNFEEVNYHYNLKATPDLLNSIAFFERKNPPAGFFPSGAEVFHLVRSNLPQTIDARWGELNAAEIAAHGTKVGDLLRDGPFV